MSVPMVLPWLSRATARNGGAGGAEVDDRHSGHIFRVVENQRAGGCAASRKGNYRFLIGHPRNALAEDAVSRYPAGKAAEIYPRSKGPELGASIKAVPLGMRFTVEEEPSEETLDSGMRRIRRVRLHRHGGQRPLAPQPI